MTIRVATFNVENLLQRFDFFRYGNLTTERALAILGVDSTDQDYFALRRSLFVANTDDSRQMTAQAVRDTAADVICLQEVESRNVVDVFHKQYVEKAADVRYGWRRVVDGNDIRGIDVAVMSQNWIRVTSHAHHTFHDFGLFNQDLVLCSQSLFRFADLGDDGLCRGGPDKGCGVIVSAIDVVVDRLD